MNKRILLCVVTIAGLSVAQARDWSYNDCIEYARQHNISLQQSRISGELSEYTLEESKAQWQPTLDFATSHTLSNTPWGYGNKNSYNSNYGLNAGWTVWNGGERENTIKRNKLQTQISSLNTEDMFRSLETDMLSVYMNILYAKESIAIYEEAVKLSEAQADRARQLMESGRTSRVDYAQLQAQYEQDRYSLVNAQGTYETRLMELKRLLELGIDTEISLQSIEWTAQEVLAEVPPIEESYQLALATDSRLKANKLEEESSDYDIKIAKAGAMPRISLNAGISTGYFAPGNNFGEQIKRSVSESIGLTLSLPILDGKRTKMAVARANAQRINAQLDTESRLNDIAQQIESCYIDLRAAQSRYTAGEEQVKSAELSNELVNEQFNLGLVNTIELLTAHNNLLEARHSLLQAKYMAILEHKMIEFYRTSSVTMP